MQGEQKLLDLGCGAGLLSNALRSSLAEERFTIHGVDAAEAARDTARRHHPADARKNPVHYQKVDATSLPFPDGTFDAVLAMDFLEHIEDPGLILREVSRVLRPGGLLFFHTFTRTPLSRFLVIDLVESFVPNTPPHLHIDSLFLQPGELRSMLANSGMELSELHALNPVITPQSLASLIFKREVPEDFEFRIDPIAKLKSGYIGMARKPEKQPTP